MSGWDVDAALNIAQARGSLDYEGYLLQDPYLAALRTGNVNPFGPNDAAGLDLLKSAELAATTATRPTRPMAWTSA